MFLDAKTLVTMLKSLVLSLEWHVRMSCTGLRSNIIKDTNVKKNAFINNNNINNHKTF